MTKKILSASLVAGAIAAALFLSAPTHAQTNQSTQGANVQNQQTPLTQSRVIQTLQQAGFQNIEIVDAAYLVHAKTKDGNTVTMLINPPTIVEEMKEPFTASSNQRAGQGGNMAYNQGYQGQFAHQGLQGAYPYGQMNYGAQGGRYWANPSPQGSSQQYPAQRNQQFQGYGASSQGFAHQGPYPNQENQNQQ